jgi:exosortase
MTQTVSMHFVPRAMWRNGWRLHHFLTALALAAIAVWTTTDAWADVLRIAIKDEESSQLWLVPIAVTWLLWVRRGRFRHCKPRGFWIGPPIAAFAAVVYLIGKIVLIQSPWHGGAVLLVVSCLITAFGREMLRDFFVVFVALLFMIPVPGPIRQRVALPLESATAHVTQQVSELVGMDVEQTGNLLRINGVDVTVGEACNGMRLTFALLMVSFVFAFSAPLRTYVRILLLLFSPVSAVLCNVIRLVPSLWVYGHYSAQTAQMFHNLTGWVMLVVAFLLLLGIIRLLRWTMLPAMTFNLAYD